MENFYIAYTKVVQNETLYFVKKFNMFPEFKDIPSVLESFGMHADFDRACEIAGIKDKEIRKQLFADIRDNESNAKIIHMGQQKEIRIAQ
jgi:hypothetical protein